MRRVGCLLLVVTLLAGCGGSDDDRSGAPTAATETVPSADTTTDTSSDTADEGPARSFDELMARLPPFDVPASPEVTAYREAATGGFLERCVSRKGGAVKNSFVKANRTLLDGVGASPGARLVSELSIDHRDNNGCPQGLGPPTSYTTDRIYRLPEGVEGQEVVRYYERRLSGWRRAFAGGQCEQTFTKADALLYVRACAQQQGSRVVPGPLRLSARAREPVEIPPAPKLPPRPYGAQYPIITKYLDNPEPSSYEAEPGATCERISGVDVPSIIIPPAPGVRAEFRNEPLELGAGSFPRYVLVGWSFERIFGDCPPTRLHLTLVSPTTGRPPFSLPFDVRARSGTARLPVLDSFRKVGILRATAESIDGARSRSVAVWIRR